MQELVAVDTNILVRYITQDDEQQAKLVEHFIQRCLDNNKNIFINNIVLCELVWVLNRGYHYSKEQIISILKQILSTKEFLFEKQDMLWQALEIFEHKSIDFSDAIIAVLNTNVYQCIKTFTLDKSAAKYDQFELLSI